MRPYAKSYLCPRALATALLEGIDPKYVLRHLAPRKYLGKQIAAYELEDIGIDNSQYFQGRGTSHTDWDDVYVGVGDNPSEAIDDALCSAAISGWRLSADIKNEAGAWPYTPSVIDEATQSAREMAEDQIDRNDYEDTADYDDAVEELTDEILSNDESELYYHAAVWLSEPKAETESHQEALDPKQIFRSFSAVSPPDTWPKIKRRRSSGWSGEEKRRAAMFYGLSAGAGPDFPGLAMPNGELKTPENDTLRPVPVGPQDAPRRTRRAPNGLDPNQPPLPNLQIEGKYLRQLARWKRIKDKHGRMKEVAKYRRDLEKVDKPDPSAKKPKKGHQHIR